MTLSRLSYAPGSSQSHDTPIDAELQAYIAFVVLSRYTELWNIKSIDMQPVFLPGVMKEAKNSPPLMSEARGFVKAVLS